MNNKIEKTCHCRTLYENAIVCNQIEYSCSCRKTKHYVKMTKEQLDYQRSIFNPNPSKNENIHYVSHACQRWLGDLTSVTAIKKMSQFIKKYPSVIEVDVDDDYHSCSKVYLIPHENKYQYWGTTILYIPQCTGEKPIRFFLYSGHYTQLVKGLSFIGKLMAKNRQKEPESPIQKKIPKPSIIQPKYIEHKLSPSKQALLNVKRKEASNKLKEMVYDMSKKSKEAKYKEYLELKKEFENN